MIKKFVQKCLKCLTGGRYNPTESSITVPSSIETPPSREQILRENEEVIAEMKKDPAHIEFANKCRRELEELRRKHDPENYSEREPVFIELNGDNTNITKKKTRFEDDIKSNLGKDGGRTP